jgi:hypothetical protein
MERGANTAADGKMVYGDCIGRHSFIAEYLC